MILPVLKIMKNRSIRRVLISGILAFLIYGAWATYANSNYGLAIALRSGLIQGLLSLLVTMSMTYGMEIIFARIKWFGLRFIFTAFGPLIFVILIMFLVHSIIGTPNIFETIAPSMIVGIIYCVSYTTGLSSISNKAKTKRYLIFIILPFLILVVAGTITLLVLKKITHTQTHGVIYIEGLHGPVFIHRDQYGVPHIIAEKSDQDAFFALGFVQAQDRLWQMEFQRHVVTGTLSEIFGKKTIPQDEFLRTWGFYRAAQAAWPTLDPNSQEIIKNYTAGINAEIQQGHVPLQILLLRYHPTPWNNYDSIAWQKMMAWQLQTSWQEKIKNYIIAKNYGISKISYYLPPYPTTGPTTLSEKDLINTNRIKNTSAKEKNLSLTPIQASSLISLLDTANNIHKTLGYLDFPSKGSNAWVVSGKFTQSGLPLLANDIHLQLTAPSLWYLVELKAPHLHVIGASIPGLPGIVTGHNDYIAWGITNGYNDAQDLFIIPATTKTRTIDEIIKVKNDKSIDLKVEISSFGPIISNVTPHMQNLPMKLAMQWPALQAGDTTVESFIKLQYANNWTQFTNALHYFVAPTQNFVYADIHGNIGYYYPGKLPIRNNSGMFFANSPEQWNGYIPFNQLPHSYNPPEGFIATANNKVTPNSYPYSLTFRWSVPPYRIERIRDLIQNNGILNSQKFMNFQHDTLSYFWVNLKSTLLTTKAFDQPSKEALLILQQWNGDFSLTSEGATIFAYWVKQFNNLWPQPLAFGDKWLQPLYLKKILSDPKMQSYLSQSLAEAMKELIATHGNNPKNWQWGKIHKAVFSESGLGQSKLVGWIWQRNIPTPGGDYTVDVGTYDPDTFVQIAGATYRQIIDLGNLNQSYYITPLGESENIFSRYYSNLLKMWRDGSYVQMNQYNLPCNPTQENCLELLPLNTK